MMRHISESFCCRSVVIKWPPRRRMANKLRRWKGAQQTT